MIIHVYSSKDPHLESCIAISLRQNTKTNKHIIDT